jgi:rare lipoprotein A
MGRNGLGAGPAGKDSVYVQVGTFRDQANAERMRRNLGHIGPVEVAPVAASGTSAYRVRIGPMTTAEAHSAQADVKAQGVKESRIVED